MEVASIASTTLGGADVGLQYALAALLQSPYFLFRIELGEPDPERAGEFRYNDFEMASKLSFFFWNTGPDAELLDVAEEGLLTTDEGLEEQVERLMSSYKSREGFRNFVDEYLELHELDQLKKDSLFFTHMDVTVGPSAREETLMNFEALVFDDDGDYRDILTSNRTFVNRKLASMYDVQSPVREGFGEVIWPEDSPRAGLLGQVSLLALNAHPVSSSATLRGLFVREKLLCQKLPPPPSDVDTSLPEPSKDAPTLRDRVAEHLTNPSCSVCHQMTDPIGLALENFDGIGRHRLRENDVLIDPSGDLDGVEFADAKGLAAIISESEVFTKCFVNQLGRYANGRVAVEGEEPGYEHLTKRFVRKNYRVQSLMREMVMSPTFRTIGGVE